MPRTRRLSRTPSWKKSPEGSPNSNSSPKAALSHIHSLKNPALLIVTATLLPRKASKGDDEIAYGLLTTLPPILARNDTYCPARNIDGANVSNTKVLMSCVSSRISASLTLRVPGCSIFAVSLTLKVLGSGSAEPSASIFSRVGTIFLNLRRSIKPKICLLNLYAISQPSFLMSPTVCLPEISPEK